MAFSLSDKRLRLAGAALLGVCLILFVSVRLSGPPNPVYQGMRLSEWLLGIEPMDAARSKPGAEQAVRAIGTNAIPYLLTELKPDETVLQAMVRNEVTDLLRNRPFLHIAPPLSPDQRIRGAYGGFRALGADALPAVMNLLRAKDKPHLRVHALNILFLMGPEVPDSSHALLDALKDDDARIRSSAAMWLATFGKPDKEVIAALQQAASDPYGRVRNHARYALAEFAREAAEARSANAQPSR
ncbi:MAG: HEAT repeat domain-containing protein [Verrucomicrobiota bacterium]